MQFSLCLRCAHRFLLTFGNWSAKEAEVPELVQRLLEKKGISVEELKSNPQLIKQWKQDLYRIRGKQLGTKTEAAAASTEFW